MKTFLLRGVPPALATDGWWLTSSISQTGEKPPTSRPRASGREDNSPFPASVGALLALIALADVMLWQVSAPGLSLFVFGAGVILAAWALAGQRGTGGLILALVSFLPVIERVQPLSLAFWFAGLALGAAWIALARFPGLSGGLRFLLHAPGQAIGDLHHLLTLRKEGDLRATLGRATLAWALPIGLSLVFLALFAEANPLFEDVLARFDPVDWLDPETAARGVFWAGIAFLAWPFLRLRAMQQRIALGLSQPRARALPALINAGSIARSLYLFNALFALQTVSDIAVLWGHAALPEGMTYAQYAHRGAYPLVATALLAGAFALVARPFTSGNGALRAALLIWVGQTVLLTISSLIRLNSYVSAYGLTHLRLSAAIWMGLVALGLCLVIWQVLRDIPARWLLLRSAALGLVTLYLCAFVPFAPIVARYNLTHDVPFDRVYLCRLDRAALPVIVAHERATRQTLCPYVRPELHSPRDWREWGFRDWRASNSLLALN
ncbi:DUF4153 domain-containing protein [Rhodalgimonas zhirmunskyi]|uniref:DUF4173 domain-containing protein n=1 Tax=Rhodalgimonas zhirmunskyi TaxID=2964767 RepID=A0AAJ1U6H7_9RHOB|nr:DUF4173 domain-containing protein [Rhodoalgimonas zhirmunskyi]MDQ2094381.1 DUF4173 domain-containing protein [Rhodoalgimonas zhirmunskyi]